MKTLRTAFFTTILVAGLAGWVFSADKPGGKVAPKPIPRQSSKASSAQTNAAASSDFRVIGYLEKRDLTVTIKSGPRGLVYSAKTADGKSLFENLTSEQLSAQAPELQEFVKSAVAGKSAKGLDARVRPKMDASVR